MNNTNEELKKCPFCGGEAKVLSKDNWTGEVCIGCLNEHCLVCPESCATSPAIPNEDGITSHWDWDKNKKEAIRKWNTRTPEVTGDWVEEFDKRFGLTEKYEIIRKAEENGLRDFLEVKSYGIVWQLELLESIKSFIASLLKERELDK